MPPIIDILATQIDLPPHIRWFFRTRVRILIVTDDAISLGSAGFGLSKVIQTLENQAFYDNAQFLITGATRSGAKAFNPAATSNQFKFTGFRFIDMPGFNINDYDQIWFFGFAPGNDGSSNDANIDADPSALIDPAEINVLASWMNAGRGGVLAMGDHHYLGASLCAKIPRVRKMRQWTNADGVPSISGSDRKDTNQSDGGSDVPFNAQSDGIPQPIEVLKRRYSESVFKIKAVPHPILCGADGVIDILPDHPHEGEVLGTRYDTGADGIPVNLAGQYPAGVDEFPARTVGTGKPEPQIIAIGHPHNYPGHEKNHPSNTNNPSHTNDTTPFGLINVYDGAEAGVGRIVTDSTWHHWLNVNLVGLDTTATAAAYLKIQNFFTNVAVWLCREELRQHMLSSWVWDFVVREFDPMRFSIHDSIWRLGIVARDVLGRRASQCTATEWIFIHIPPLREKFKIPDLGGPCLTCPPFEVFEIAILGGIVRELVPLVEKYRLSEHHTRKLINTKEIGEAVSRGIVKGHEELLTTLKESIARTEGLLRVATKALRQPDAKLFEANLKSAKLRITIESVLLNSPINVRAAMAKGASFSVRVSNQFVQLTKTPVVFKVSKAQVASAAKQGDHLSLKTDLVVIEDTFQDGEELRLELFLNNDSITSENKIWEFVLDGEVESWIGSHQPPLETEQCNMAAGVWLNVSRMKG